MILINKTVVFSLLVKPLDRISDVADREFGGKFSQRGLVVREKETRLLGRPTTAYVSPCHPKIPIFAFLGEF
jgi:hypothetical protein